MVKHKDEKYLVPLSSVHTDSISTMLTDNKLRHKECVMYRTVSNDLTEEEKASFDYDMLVFFSPTGVRALKEKSSRLCTRRHQDCCFRPSNSQRGERPRLTTRLRSTISTASFYDRGITCLLRRAKEIKKQEIDLLKYASLNTKKVYS